MSNFIIRVGKAFSIAGIVGTISDVLQPVAPVASYVMGVSAIVFVLLVITRFISKTWNETLAVSMYLACGLFLFSSILFFCQNTDEQSKEQGILAANISLARDFQKNLGLVQKDIKKILEHTKSIDKKMDNVKKETSSDPRKELANFNLPWTREGLMDAIRQDSVDMVTLYAKGGMKLWVDQAYFSAYLNEMSDEVAGVLAQYKSYDTGKYCGLAANLYIYSKNTNGDGKRRLIRQVCQQKEDLNRLKAYQLREEMALKEGTYAKEKAACYSKVAMYRKELQASKATIAKQHCDEMYYKSVSQLKSEKKKTIQQIQNLIKIIK